ncbi:apiosidase-like domain-containing protein [Streptococcus dentiloxodontae]
MFKVSNNNRCFEKNGTKIFYLADTCWSAFTNISEEDWEYYLDYRKSQGFNVIQVNMLQQWDASQTKLNYKPFEVNDDGSFNYQVYNEAYFERAYRMFEQASQKGLTIALVLLWSNYLPDTWASQMPLKQFGIFPKDKVADYVDKVVELYDKFDPIYIISGDTDFQTEEVVNDYYNLALNRVKQKNPNALTALHIRGREADLPKTLKENPNLDFYMYQSGHNSEFQTMTYKLAETFYNMTPKRPLLNSEPCYEMMGYSRRVYGRFSREDVRKAAWQSVLSGAGSGVTYGAHGIWSWHNGQLAFDSSVGEAFESPYDWHDALHFKGAWDYAFLKDFIERNDLFDLEPTQYLLENDTEDIRVSKNKDVILIYIPSNINIKLSGNLSDKKMTYLDLENKERMEAAAHYLAQKNQTQIQMHRFVKDALLIINL